MNANTSPLWFQTLHARTGSPHRVCQALKVAVFSLGFVLTACASGPRRPMETEACKASAGARPRTFANPLNLDYRFVLSGPSHRTAADPMVLLDGDDYYLFATATGGYWRSSDLLDWTLIVPDGLPLDAPAPQPLGVPAPSVVKLGGHFYYTAHKLGAIYATDDLALGHWHKAVDIDSYADPDFFLDDDGRLYLYFGAALNGGISVVEMDPRDGFRVVSGPFRLFEANYADHGWERSGPDNLGAEMSEGFRIAPYIEGPWMTKHSGTYYLQYSAPGTVWKTYSDGVYTSRSPTEGFTYAPSSPFSYKPGGFIGGAGHATTFQDKAGRYWRVATMIVSVAHKFERRLGLFPVGFDADGTMRMNSYLGDYPQLAPGEAPDPLAENLVGWMLLSGGKPATASSSVSGHPAVWAFDEDIRTWWSARTAEAGEWLQVDLGYPSCVEAVQINAAEHESRAAGREALAASQYVLEGSDDGTHWRTLVDKSDNQADVPHDYVQFDDPARVRYVRLTNVRTAGGGPFSVRDLRVFGRADVAAPAEVTGVTARREAADPRNAVVSWSRSAGARGYVVRFGISHDKLYSSVQVGDTTQLGLHSLNRGVAYSFAVDAFNERGVVKGREVVVAE